MSEPTGDQPRISLYDHAVRLHTRHPDGPLPGEGKPYPDEARYKARPRRSDNRDRRRDGADVAEALDRHFAAPDADPAALAVVLDGFDAPIHLNDHITAAALRADHDRVQATGRWLVRYGTGRDAVVVGLALLAADWDPDDIPLIRTIGLLSNTFGSLAADALKRRRGGSEALVWLGDRVAGWGRVYVVEALCAWGSGSARDWLLRKACDGDPLNGYFAGEVATAAHLHEAITAPEADDELVDHTGRLLRIMAASRGMGLTLADYPPARLVLEAHARHLSNQEPAVRRYQYAAEVANAVFEDGAGLAEADRDRIVAGYLSTLDRDEWCAVAQADASEDDPDWWGWFLDFKTVPLRAFP
ncbi:hypothetical protein [Saccharothrix variisporea]|uniref:Uncharacterized protein n=1 Tax=Saccharothrix variisporea TaxID=543527 RepID=A0A495X9E8_9PSEU|nr:hypothetical protein [Saccharothrix variisporea]RKT69996.1 hypothetical protein DFJ66_3237 [Saccharothrix variisporea]